MKKKYDVCVIGGLGHVGLPLGITFASKNLKVCLHDLNEEHGKYVMDGNMPFVEHGSETALKNAIDKGNLVFDKSKKSISEAKYVVITIGTPIDEFMNPKIDGFLKFIKEIKPLLDTSQTIIIRSSVAPRTCEQVLKVLGSPNKWNLSYCPERIVQGYAIQELEKLPQIISGFSEEAINSSKKLFKKITKKLIVTSTKEAEMIKLFSNAWRYVQFALANQFFMISHDYGIDYNAVRNAMVEGYERASQLPGAGFAAGPCLLKDTMQLANTFKNGFQLGHSAMIVNEGLPNYIVENIKLSIDIEKTKIGILGMSFKAEIDDIRDSLSFKLKKRLLSYGAELYCTDEYAKSESFFDLEIVLKKSKVIIIAVPHNKYKKIKFRSDQIIVDLWNISHHTKKIL